MLVPHSECQDLDLFEDYKFERQNMAETKKSLHMIDASSSNQPCNKFGIHREMKDIQQLYQDGDLLWVANAGNSELMR